jgi:hypothetical protein
VLPESIRRALGQPRHALVDRNIPIFCTTRLEHGDQFFRPGFTQGTCVDGEFWKGLHYELFVGNGLNTLTVPTPKIDRHLVYSGSAWWEPLGVYGMQGRARGMYDDYQHHNRPVIRVGVASGFRSFSLRSNNVRRPACRCCNESEPLPSKVAAVRQFIRRGYFGQPKVLTGKSLAS